MWTVISEKTQHGPVYIVINKSTGERRGRFECRPWAENKAKELSMREDNAKMFNKRL